MIKSVNNQDFKIIAVSNRKLCNRPFLEQIERVCKIHPEAVILREKDLTEEEYGTLAKEVMNICSRYQVSCILHNFWKTALELGCYTWIWWSYQSNAGVLKGRGAYLCDRL